MRSEIMSKGAGRGECAGGWGWRRGGGGRGVGVAECWGARRGTKHVQAPTRSQAPEA